MPSRPSAFLYGSILHALNLPSVLLPATKCSKTTRMPFICYMKLSARFPDNPLPLFHAADCFKKKKLHSVCYAALEEVIRICGNDPRYSKIAEKSRMLAESEKKLVHDKLSNRRKMSSPVSGSADPTSHAAHSPRRTVHLSGRTRGKCPTCRAEHRSAKQHRPGDHVRIRAGRKTLRPRRSKGQHSDP